MDLALGKLKTPEGIEMIWLPFKLMETFVAEGELNAPEEIDEILLDDKPM